MNGRCVGCGATGPVDRHHPTGRPAPDGAYLDPALTVVLCRSCHVAEHAGLRRLRLEWAAGGDVLAHRLRRFGVLAAGLSAQGRGLALDVVSTGALAELVLTGADRYGPHFRTTRVEDPPRDRGRA